MNTPGTRRSSCSRSITRDTYIGAGDRTYDAENRMTQAWANSQWQVYTYNGDGQRTRRKVDGVETWQVYGMDGDLLAEYAANAAAAIPQKEYGYRNGLLLITAAGRTENVVWNNAVGVSVSGNSLTKTAAAAWGNGGAASTQALVSGDGYVEFTAHVTSTIGTPSRVRFECPAFEILDDPLVTLIIHIKLLKYLKEQR